MTNSRWIVVLFAALCVAQLAVPAELLISRERTLAAGEPFRFRCAPLDPVDALRGRYVALRFDADDVPAGDETLHRGERVAVPVATGPDGFARLGRPSQEPPASGAWIEVELRADCPLPTCETVAVHLPFERFYMEEGRAKATDRALARGGDQQVEAVLAVRVRDGRAVPEELFLDGLPVREYLDGEP